MNLTALQESWDADCAIDKYDLDTEAANIPSLHNKYLKIWNEERLRWVKLDADNKRLESNKRRFYLGQMDREELDDLGWAYDGIQAAKSNSGADKYVYNDVEVIRHSELLNIQEQKLKFIEEILRSINNRSFAIGHAIAFQKFTQGSG
jgi:hypothetical protein